MLKSLIYHLTWGTCFAPPPPSPLQIAVADWEQAQKELLHHSTAAEDENGKVKVLNIRIERLRKDMERLGTEQRFDRQERQAES